MWHELFVGYDVAALVGANTDVAGEASALIGLSNYVHRSLSSIDLLQKSLNKFTFVSLYGRISPLPGCGARV
jgi:hypothetical protein